MSTEENGDKIDWNNPVIISPRNTASGLTTFSKQGKEVGLANLFFKNCHEMTVGRTIAAVEIVILNEDVIGPILNIVQLHPGMDKAVRIRCNVPFIHAKIIGACDTRHLDLKISKHLPAGYKPPA